MKNWVLFSLILIPFALNNSQTLIETFDFPRYTYYDYFWGITEKDNYFWIGTDYTPTTSAFAKIYKVTKTGTILDSLTGPIKSNHGIEWDGTNFWLAEEYRSPVSRIYKVNSEGVIIDSFLTPAVNGSPVLGIGDIALDGNKLWYTVFSPDFVTYPNDYAFAIDINTMQLVDTIPLRSRQPIGIAVKGDTVFYVSEAQYAGETEKIIAYSKSAGDTIFSFPVPDPDGVCNPKGLYWDGEYLWLLAERIGNSSWVYKTLYKYSFTGQGNPVISVPVNILDFGTVIIGQSSTQTLSINNIGTGALIIDSLVFSNNSFGLLSGIIPDTIQPSQSKDYVLSFTPAVYDSVFGTLQIHSNDGGTPVKTIQLKGKGIQNGSFIYTPAASYNYGMRRNGSLCVWDFKILNQGNQALNINSMNVLTPNFKIDTVGVLFPVNIQSQQERYFRVWFKPSEPINYNDTLIINSNAVNSPVLKINLSGAANNPAAVMGDILWNAVVPQNPFAYTNDLQPMSTKEIQDVNYDGIKDIIIASRNYLVLCYNGNSSVQGDLLWSFNTGYDNNNTGAVMFEDALQIRDDIDGDGIQDVVFGCGGGNEMVYTISGRNGALVWAYGDSISYNDGDINGLRADKDFNNDGVKDVVISASGSSTGGRHAAICLNGLNGNPVFNAIQAAAYTYDITTLQNGGVICVDQNNGGPIYLNGFNNYGGAAWSVNVPDVIWSMKETKDLNDDGIKDFVSFCGGIDVNVFARSAVNGSLIWNVHYPNFAVFSNIKLISDLDGNGYEDMIFSGKEGVFRLDSKTGSSIWTNPLDYSYVFGVDELLDLNEDGINEIAAGTKNANLYILDGSNGYVLHQYSFGNPIDNAVERAVRLGSIDGNYSSEIIAASKDGRIKCFSGGPGEMVPVELALFEASVDKNDVHLVWRTATETNCKGFKLYRNGKEIAFISGSGTSTELRQYDYTDKNLADGKYLYELVEIDLDSRKESLSKIEININNLPKEFSLSRNYPNPFNPATKIEYSLPEISFVTLTVYNINGEKVRTLINEKQEAGYYTVEFNAKELPSGMYIYKLEAGRFIKSSKMILLK